MRVKSVTREVNHYTDYANERLIVRFEHAGMEWEKFFPLNADEITHKKFFQSIIDDTLARNTRWDQN